MDTDREFEHMMMSVRNSSGSITQMVYAANMLQIKLVQFVARLAYKGYLSVKSRDDLAAFAKLSEGKYTIYSIPVSTEHVNDLKQLEALKLKLQSVSGKDEKKQIQKKLEKYFGMSEKRAAEYLEHFLQEIECLSAI